MSDAVDKYLHDEPYTVKEVAEILSSTVCNSFVASFCNALSSLCSYQAGAFLSSFFQCLCAPPRLIGFLSDGVVCAVRRKMR